MPKKDEKRYEVITQEDNNGDLLLPIPPEVLQKLGWKEGDTIEIAKGPNNEIILKRGDGTIYGKV